MIWKTYNLKRFLARLAGLLACSLALLPSSGSGETWDSYRVRLTRLWESVDPVWCWDKVPNPQTYWNAYYDAICCWSDSSASYSHTYSPIYSGGTDFSVYGSIASNFPASGHVFPFLDQPPGYNPGQFWVGPIEDFSPVYILDPSFPFGSSVPFGWGSYSGFSPWSDSPSNGRYTQTNRTSGTMLVGRAYVLPQRVFVTNGWNYGTNSLLWDMYGDGRLFLPRLVAECGFLSQQNVVPFDPSLWEQLHFRGEYTRSKTVTSAIDWQFLSPGTLFTNAIWWDGVTRRANSANSSISVVVTNQNLFGTNMLSPSQFPRIYELFGLPSAGATQADASWRFMRYVPDSVQRGDFGVALRMYRPDWSPSEWSDFGKGGIRGLCFAPVSRQNGATLRFSRFVFQPIPRQRSQEPFGRLTIYVPSGLAWDNDGGCCFNWSKDGQPLSSLFKWPLTAAWDYSYQIDIATNGNSLMSSGGTTHTNINSRVPGRNPSPPDNVPPLPSPPRGGTIFGGGGAGGGGTTFLPLNPSGESFSFTSGITLNSSTATGGSGGRDTPTSSSSLTYQNTASTLAMDDNGDLLGEFKLHLPTYGDFYTWDDIEDRDSLDFKLSRDLGIQAGWLDNDALWDWAPAGMPDGAFGGVLQNPMDTSEGFAPEMDGFYNYFDTGNEWWYEHLSYDPVFPRLNTLVLPWPEHTADGWDWTATRTFELPEDFARYRTILFWVFGVGLSLLFVALVMALFSRGAN